LLDRRILIDYKTGRYDEQRHARYEWQLLLYSAAVRDLLGKQPELAIIHYLDEDKTVELVPDSGQIESALRHAKEVIGEMCSMV
jgi:CRISPR/Cas system-associated exonuclease Cas4 (RecB family)